MRTMSLLVGSIIVTSGIWMACGGSVDSSSLLADGDSGSPSPSPSPSDTTTTTPPVDTDAGDDGSASDAGPEAAGGDGGVNPPDAAPGGSTSVLTCGATSCAIPAETCCVQAATGGGTAYGCVSGSTCPAPDGGFNGDHTALKCSSQANCSTGTVCCAHQAGGGAGVTATCEATCTSGVQLCDPTATPTGCTGDAGTCKAPQGGGDMGLPPTYGTCGGRGF